MSNDQTGETKECTYDECDALRAQGFRIVPGTGYESAEAEAKAAKMAPAPERELTAAEKQTNADAAITAERTYPEAAKQAGGDAKDAEKSGVKPTDETASGEELAAKQAEANAAMADKRRGVADDPAPQPPPRRRQ